MRKKSKKSSTDNLLADLLEGGEDLYNTSHSDWRARQGVYNTDLDAKKKLKDFFRLSLKVSQLITFALVFLIFAGIIKMTFFTNFETVILDDSSQLFCTITDDGTVAIAY